MLRLCFRQRRFYQRVRLPLPRPFSSSSNNSLDSYSNLRNPQNDPPPPAIIKPGPFITTTASPTSSSSYLSRSSVLALFATVVSAAAAASYHALPDKTERSPNPLHDALERAFFRANESFKRVFLHARQTGAAASVLWQSLTSVLSSANHEVRVGFELRVASLLADIAAANSSRRSALVGAGGGKVVDWLLETVATDGGRDGFRTQAEAARTLAYLIADPNVSPKVLGRPHAVPYLLRFIFSCQPKKKKKKHTRRSSFDVSDSLKGRSMLVAAIMDIVTANCDSIEKVSFKPSLPRCAETRDIAAAIEVIEEGGLHMDQSNESEDNDDGGGGSGMKGIGIKILEGETALGLARTSGIVELEQADSDGVDSFSHSAKTLALLHRNDVSLAQTSLSAAIVPGLWDDLHCQHVAVPFAVWALANWAMASEVNRLHIHELDQDGRAIMTALMAPERSVKWHGSLVARLLLEDRNLSLNDSVADWSSSLLTTISQASENEDMSLALVALPAFLLSVEKCPEARRIVMDKGLQQMRETAKRTTKHKQVQEALAKALELLSDGDFRLSLEESQKWSGILIPWVFTRASSEKLRSSATKILSCILEGHGPASIPISQGWLAIMLHEVLGSIKGPSVKGSTQPKADKTQVDQSNIAFATQASNQLAVAVVNLALNQLGKTIDSVVTFPLTDLFNLEPFAGPFKNLKKDTIPKFDVADSAMATLKGIKALTELCSDDAICQDKLAESGVFCLLRRFLLCDDYEKLAAIKAYDASRALEVQEKPSNASDSSDADADEQLSVRVPPTAHIRKHAARLLTVLSALPKVQKIILADKLLCKWLEDCASGTIPGCTDPKLQSYARATLLNASCCHRVRGDSFSSNVPVSVVTSRRTACPYYNDMILLINPERPHWKGCENTDFDMVNKENLPQAQPESGDGEGSNVGNDPSDSELDVPPLDVIFVHGLRGGPYKSWRLADDKTSTKSGLVEKIDEEAGRMGTFWPGEWLSDDFPEARLFTIKYKTNYTQWSGATLPLQEVSSKLLDKLVAAGIGNRPVVFVTHSMGGLVVKQMLHKAKAENLDNLVNNTIGVVFYSCPHFGSKLADMPLRIGLVLRPAPTIGELRSGSPRLLELNDFIRQLHKKGPLEVLSFCETKVTPIVEGYGGWAVRMEIVPIESAYPGFGELVVLESTDHINTCKPISRSDPSYKETLEFLRKLKAHYS